MPRYKDKALQKTFESGLTLTYPVNWEKYKIGGSPAAAWNNGYLGLRMRHAKGSLAYALYYAGKEVKKREQKNSGKDKKRNV